MTNHLFWFDDSRTVRLDDVSYAQLSSGSHYLVRAVHVVLRNGVELRFNADTNVALRFTAALRAYAEDGVEAAYKRGFNDAL